LSLSLTQADSRRTISVGMMGHLGFLNQLPRRLPDLSACPWVLTGDLADPGTTSHKGTRLRRRANRVRLRAHPTDQPTRADNSASRENNWTGHGASTQSGSEDQSRHERLPAAGRDLVYFYVGVGVGVNLCVGGKVVVNPLMMVHLSMMMVHWSVHDPLLPQLVSAAYSLIAVTSKEKGRMGRFRVSESHVLPWRTTARYGTGITVTRVT
jgi:hypothetical protein